MTLYLIDCHAGRFEPIPLTVEEMDCGIWNAEVEIADRYACSIMDVDCFPITSAGVQYDTSIDSDSFECISYLE